MTLWFPVVTHKKVYQTKISPQDGQNLHHDESFNVDILGELKPLYSTWLSGTEKPAQSGGDFLVYRSEIRAVTTLRHNEVSNHSGALMVGTGDRGKDISSHLEGQIRDARGVQHKPNQLV